MEEKENLEVIEEQETLNNNEKTSYTSEEVEEIKKQMQSNSEKWVQKLISEKKAYDEAFNYLGMIADEPEKLVSLYDEKPEVAKIILAKYYDWQNIEEFKEDIWYKVNPNDPKEIEKIINSGVEKKLEAKLIDEKKEAFIKKLKLSEKEKKDFEDAFEERKKLKSFSIENLEKIFEKSYRDIDWDLENLKEYKNNLEKANLMASSLFSTTSKNINSKKDLTDVENNSRKEVRSFFEKFKTE